MGQRSGLYERLPRLTRRTTPCQAREHLMGSPVHIATADQWRAPGLRPSTSEPDGIIEYQHGNKSGICGLFDRSKAVPA